MINNFLLRTLICRTDELPPFIFIARFTWGLIQRGAAKHTPKFHLIPAYTKNSHLCGKNNSITRSISKFIALIYFSIKITIKEKLAKNGGHLSPGNTIVYTLFYIQLIVIDPYRSRHKKGMLFGIKH